MKPMLTRRIIVLGIAMLAAARGSNAQPAVATPAETPPPAEVHGSFDVGYRFTDITGSADTFHQLFGLSDGARLFGVDVRTTGGDNAFADSFALNSSGLGGDPFPTLQVTLAKARRYDLRVNWRSHEFFSVAPLTPDSIDGFDTRAVTDAHSWQSRRRLGSVALTVDATRRLRFLFGYDRNVRDGTAGSTRAIDFVGAPSSWGAFARANPYPVEGPLDDTANRFAGGVSYGGEQWTFNYKAGYQTYDETQTLAAETLPERSINVADQATATELLSAFHWSQARSLTTPFSELSFVGRLSDTFEWRGEHIYYRYEGPSSLDAAFEGVARTNSAGTAFAPYDIAIATKGQTGENNHVLGQGLTYRPSNTWAFDLDYRYSRFATETTGQLMSEWALAAGANPQATSEEDDTEWRQTLHTVDVTAMWEPLRSLSIRPGVRLAQRDVTAREDGNVVESTTGREQTAWPELSVAYRPTRAFSARGVLKNSYSDASYTRMSPLQRNNAHLVVTVKPATGLTIDMSVDRTDSEALASGFVSNLRSASFQTSYDLSDRFSVMGGFEYQSYLGLGTATFVRGPAPIVSDEMRDREILHLWLAGVTAKLTSHLGIIATGNFNTTQGTDTIVGEPPLYGPTTFPYGTVSVYYDVPMVGKVSVDLQRTYYFQEILPLNDFRANLVTIRYSRGF